MANHMTQWKPEATLNGKTIRYKTYAELKKNLFALLEESENRQIFVSRSRRGQWGEWFEYWGLNYKHKPVIIKQGWM